MMMTAGIGGPAVMKAYVTDKNTGASTMLQGTNAADLQRATADWSAGQQKQRNQGLGGMTLRGNAGGGFSLGGGNSDFVNQSMQQSQQIQGMRNQGAFGGTANQVGKPASGFNTVPQGQTNVMYPMGNPALGIAPMNGGAGLPGGGASIGGLLGQQQAQNDAARAENKANVAGAQQGLRDVGNQYNNSDITSMTRNRVSELLNDPESINDSMANSIRGRNENQIRSQTDNMVNDQAGMLAANGGLDTGSLMALKENASRGSLAQTQASNMDLDVQRAQMRNQDRMNAIGVGQRQGAQDAGIGLDINKSILQNLPQVSPDDLSGWAALAANGGGAGAGGMNMQQGLGGVGGGFANGQSNVQNEFGGRGFQVLGGRTGAKGRTGNGQSTYAGFDDMFDTTAADVYDHEMYDANKFRENQNISDGWARLSGPGRPLAG